MASRYLAQPRHWMKFTREQRKFSDFMIKSSKFTQFHSSVSSSSQISFLGAVATQDREPTQWKRPALVREVTSRYMLGWPEPAKNYGDKISISRLRHPAPSPLTHQTLPSDGSQAGCRLCPPPRLPWSSRENSSLCSPSPESLISNVQRRGKEKLSTGPKSWRERVDSAGEGREKRNLKLETSVLGTDLGYKEFKRSRQETSLHNARWCQALG